MGEELFCEYCGASVPLATAFTPIKVGDKFKVDVCVHCKGTVQNILEQARAGVTQDRKNLLAMGEEYISIQQQEAKAAKAEANKEISGEALAAIQDAADAEINDKAEAEAADHASEPVEMP